MTIRKVKWDGQEIEIKYEVTTAGGILEEYDFKCSDKPAPSFVKALEGLRPHIARICEMAPGWETDLDVRGVSITWGGEGGEIMGMVATALKPLAIAKCYLVINTPHAIEKAYNASAACLLLPSGCPAALRKLMEEAAKYINGEREQSELPLSGSADMSTASDGTRKRCPQCGKRPTKAGRHVFCSMSCYSKGDLEARAAADALLNKGQGETSKAPGETKTPKRETETTKTNRGRKK